MFIKGKTKYVSKIRIKLEERGTDWIERRINEDRWGYPDFARVIRCSPNAVRMQLINMGYRPRRERRPIKWHIKHSVLNQNPTKPVVITSDYFREKVKQAQENELYWWGLSNMQVTF